MQRIEAILFDWGGVLIEDPAPGLMQHCAGALGVSVAAYTAAHSRHGEPFQKGQITEEVFWQRICTDLGCSAPQVQSLWGQAFRDVYVPRAEVFALARRLHEKGYEVGLLSNTEAPAMALWPQLVPDAFDALVFSCAEGAVKPERDVYEIAAGKLNVTPPRCLLIDDKPAYVQGARNAGMQAIVYESLPQVERELAELGVRMPQRAV
jgi:putative hydrolase of the HAD superfamily